MVLPVLIIVAVSLRNNLFPDLSDWPLFYAFFFVGILILIAVPMIYFYLFDGWGNSHKTFEKMMSLKKSIWFGVLYALGGSTACVIFGFIAVKHWIAILPPSLSVLLIPVIFIPVTLLLCLLGIFLTEHSSAFQKNAMAVLLQNHPRGKEVLDEFVGQAESL